jgi:hypothetical protein
MGTANDNSIKKYHAHESGFNSYQTQTGHNLAWSTDLLMTMWCKIQQSPTGWWKMAEDTKDNINAYNWIKTNDKKIVTSPDWFTYFPVGKKEF